MELDKKHDKDIELRSEEVQEVMYKLPPYIMRWGIMILFIIISFIIVGCYIWKSPEVIQASITISTHNPPAYVLAHTPGKLDTLYTYNNQDVDKNMVLGVIENAANINDIVYVKNSISDWLKNDKSLNIGEQLFNIDGLCLGNVQSAYSAFRIAYEDYINFNEQKYYEEKINNIKEQISNEQKYYSLALKQDSFINIENTLAVKSYIRDSILFHNRAIIATEFENSQKSYLQNLQSKNSSQMSLEQLKMQLQQNSSALLEMNHQEFENRQRYETNLQNAIEQLNLGIISWEKKYLLKAPISGKLTYMSVWSKNQNVEAGETVFVIAPHGISLPIGKALVPIKGSGKVKNGQQVNIYINNYPDMEFGFIKGVIYSISPIPTGEGYYTVFIAIPNGLRTNYNIELPVTREMKGKADIVTQDMRLIERIFNPIKSLLHGE